MVPHLQCGTRDGWSLDKALKALDYKEPEDTRRDLPSRDFVPLRISHVPGGGLPPLPRPRVSGRVALIKTMPGRCTQLDG
jgi:hypothetical protein